jgi:polygalacturonase
LRRVIRVASLSTGEVTTTILFPENNTFCTGPLNVTSQITLQVDGTLRALNWTETDWPQIPPLASYGNSRDAGFYLQYQAFLYATDSHDISIVGKGVIDGRGQAWWDAFSSHDRSLAAGRPNLVQFVNCQNMEVSGVTLKDSPFWCLHPVLCTDVHIHHIKIRSHMYAQNSDGIDPDSSRNVLIEDNDISCGDDHIAIKAGVCGNHSGSPLDCDKIKAFTDGTYETVNVTIRRNIFRTGMGIALGSELSGGIRDVLIEDNLVGVCQPGHCNIGCCGWSPGLHLKTTDTRGGHMKNIVFRNNTVYNTTSLILLETDYQTDETDNTGKPTKIENLSFQSNRGRGTAKGISFSCNKDLPCTNVTFLNNDFDPTVSIDCKNVEVIDQNGRNVCSAMAASDDSSLQRNE